MAQTVSEIIDLVRDLTGLPDETQRSDITILGDINNFYQNKFWLEIGMRSILERWNFQLLPDTDEYAVSETRSITKGDRIRLNGDYIRLYFDPEDFDIEHQDSYIKDESIGTGDGSTTNFTGTLDNTPVVFKTLIIGDDVEVFKDNGDGTMTSNLGSSGTIIYSTGVYNITFATAPTDGQAISGTYAIYTASTPRAVLYYDSTLKFRPIPDIPYDVFVETVTRPTALTLTGSPPNLHWGDMIAYGTAIDILSRLGASEEVAIVRGQYLEVKDLVMAHQAKIDLSRRAFPSW